MKQAQKLHMNLAFALGVIMSLLLLFNTTQRTPENYEIIQKDGISIYCDSDQGSAKSRCVGAYQRGWPAVVYEQGVVSSEDGRVSYSSDFYPLPLLFNMIVLSLAAYGAIKLYERQRT